MTNVVSNIFGSKDQELVAVTILPWLARNAGTGTITLPVGYTWGDFEYVEWGMGIQGNGKGYGSITIPKEQLVAKTDWASVANYNTGDYTNCDVIGVSSTTARWASAGATAAPSYMKGYLKRYASTNNSTIIQLTPDNTTGGTFTAGGEIQAGQRYELDIASVLGADWVDAQGIEVIVEVFSEGIWADPKWLFYEQAIAYYSEGVRATVTSDGNIVVRTGTQRITNIGVYSGSPFTTTATEALCRIRVNKGDQVATRLVGNGGAGKTVLWTGNAQSIGDTLTLTDSFANYDVIVFEGQVDANGNTFNEQFLTGAFVGLSGNKFAIMKSITYGATAFSMWYSISTDSHTLLRVEDNNDVQWASAIYTIYGINYA